MSSIIVKDTFAEAALNLQLAASGTAPITFTYKAFTNNYTPTPTSTVGNFTECAAAGYASHDVANIDWTIANDSSGNNSATAPNFTWTITAATTIYGYFVLDDSGNLCWSERYDSAVVIDSGGGAITQTPKYQTKTPIA